MTRKKCEICGRRFAEVVCVSEDGLKKVKSCYYCTGRYGGDLIKKRLGPAFESLPLGAKRKRAKKKKRIKKVKEERKEIEEEKVKTKEETKEEESFERKKKGEVFGLERKERKRKFF